MAPETGSSATFAVTKALGYVRVSTDGRLLQAISLEAQEHAIGPSFESQGYELLDVILDSGVSGSTRPSDRRGLHALWSSPMNLLVWKFDRRPQPEAVTTVNGMQRHYGILRS